MPSRVILALALRSAEQETPMPTGQEAPWRGRRTTRTSRRNICRRTARRCRSRGRAQERFSQFEVAEGAAVFVAGGGEGVVVFGGGELHGFEAVFGGGAADDEGEVVGRAGGGAERAHFSMTELLEALD
jgi:hypothetical protein